MFRPHEHNWKIIQVGTPDDIYEKPSSKFVAEFIGKSNILEGIYENGVIEIEGVGRIKVKSKIAGKKIVQICIKPERISIGKSLKNLDNILEGKIEEIFYEGRTINYRVSLLNDFTITVTSVKPKEFLKIGERVNIGWNKEDAWVIPS